MSEVNGQISFMLCLNQKLNKERFRKAIKGMSTDNYWSYDFDEDVAEIIRCQKNNIDYKIIKQFLDIFVTYDLDVLEDCLFLLKNNKDAYEIQKLLISSYLTHFYNDYFGDDIDWNGEWNNGTTSVIFDFLIENKFPENIITWYKETYGAKK